MSIFSKKAIKALESAERKINKANDKLIKLEKAEKKLQKEIRDDLSQIARIGIDKYYESYLPNSYVRSYDLYNLFVITVNEEEFSITYDYEQLETHEVGLRPYIYEYMFMQGYHGGAVSGPNHPDPGIPWYKNSSDNFKSWLRPAEKSESPYEEIENDSSKYLKSAVEKRNKEIIEPARQVIDDVKSNVEKVVSIING